MNNRLTNQTANNLSKFNNNIGQPLKCIVTNNPNTLKLLNQSGSLIVLDRTDIDPTLGEDYREIYLGDNFLASGYGVHTKDQQIALLEIINTFYDKIRELNDKDEVLTSVIQGYVDDLMEQKLDKSGENADISETYITFTNGDEVVGLQTRDILQLIANIPEYKNFEIEDVQYNITIVDYSGHDQSFTNSIDSSIHLPINTYLKQLIVDIYINLNDCGNITQAIFDVAQSYDAETNEIIYNTKTVIPSDAVKIRLSKYYNAGDFYIKDGENKIINNITLDINETPESKYKTIGNIVDAKTGEAIKYGYNALVKQRTSVTIPSVIGDYFLGYYTSTQLPQSESVIASNLTYSEIDNNTYTELSVRTNAKFIAILLPINYEIYDVRICINNQETNITNFVNYYPHISDNIIINKLKSSMYVIYLSNGLKNNAILHLYTKYVTKTYDEMITSVDQANIINTRDNQQKYILNGEYLHSYWIDENDKNKQLQYMNQDINHLQYSNL